MFPCRGNRRIGGWWWWMRCTLTGDGGRGGGITIGLRARKICRTRTRVKTWEASLRLRATPWLTAPTTYLLINSRQLISIQRNFDVAEKYGRNTLFARSQDGKWDSFSRDDTKIWGGKIHDISRVFNFSLERNLIKDLIISIFRKREIWSFSLESSRKEIAM